MKRIKDIIINILFAASCVFIGFVLWHTILFASFTIPSSSMKPTLMPGDVVLVDKCVTGARLFDPFLAASGQETHIWRTPQFRKFRRNDIIVFNFVHCNSWSHIKMNFRQYYIKRCIGVPGDTIRITDFQYIVNSDSLSGYPPAEDFERIFPDDSTATGIRGYLCEKEDSVDRWTIRNFGPYVIPGHGMTLPIDSISYRRYRKAIQWETKKSLKCDNGSVWLGDSIITEYKFRENYYFTAGDNALESLDSRYWGLVPEPFIVGRAFMIWMSKRHNKLNWSRTGKLI